MTGKDNSLLEEKSKKKGRNKNEKRKDNLGRNLDPGESQDSQGRYIYTYYDKYHKRRMVRSWKLSRNDKVPKGKRDCLSLKELEEQIKKDLYDGIDTFVSKKATLNDRFKIYIDNHFAIKDSTKNNYVYIYNHAIRDEIGRLPIADINSSQIQNFYKDLIFKKGYKPNSIGNVHTVLNPIFSKAISDHLITENPCTEAMKEIRNMEGWQDNKKSSGKNVIRKALSPNQQKALIDFLNENSEKYSRWVVVITVLLGTGLRIGECIGLSWDYIDFEENTIEVYNNLTYRQWEDGKCYYKVNTPKTDDSARIIPMFDYVNKCLWNEKERQEKIGYVSPKINGVGNFVFYNVSGNVLSARSVNRALYRIVRDYNDIEIKKAKEENRRPKLLPHITNHTLRYTFCTRLVEMSVPVKVVQTLMGHASFETTMNIYATIEQEYNKQVIKKFDTQMYLGQN